MYFLELIDFLVFSSGIEPFRRSNTLTCEATHTRVSGGAKGEVGSKPALFRRRAPRAGGVTRGGRVMRARCVAGDVGAEPAGSRTRTDGCQGARGSGSPAMGWTLRGRVSKRHLDSLGFHLFLFPPPPPPLMAGIQAPLFLPSLSPPHKLSNRLRSLAQRVCGSPIPRMTKRNTFTPMVR